jgi:hypothetical protein
LPITIYEMPVISEEVVDTLSVGVNPIGGLQRAGQDEPAPAPRFVVAPPPPILPGPGIPDLRAALSVGGRTENWHAVDVLLGDLNLVAGHTYRITVQGVSSQPLQLLFPLDASPWEFGTVTGTAAEVSMEFDGATVTGQEQHRIRINTNATNDFIIQNIRIELIRCCDGLCVTCTCPPVSGTDLPPAFLVTRTVHTEVCLACGVEKTWMVTRRLNPITREVISERRSAKRNNDGELLAPCEFSKRIVNRP